MKVYLLRFLPMLLLGVLPNIYAGVFQDGTPKEDKSKNDDSEPVKISFDPSFIYTNGDGDIDLSRFSYGGSASPGYWLTDIYVNGEFISKEKVLFSKMDNGKVLPCISIDVIKKIPFNYEEVPSSFNSTIKNHLECYNIEQLIVNSREIYDSSLQKLEITIPTVYLKSVPRGYVNPELWDHGVPAILFSHYSRIYTNSSYGKEYNSAFSSIRGGVNIGAWYFRHDGYFNWNSTEGKSYSSVNNYVQRDIPSIHGRVLLGESNTSGLLFDSLPFKGISLVNDDRMLPQSQRGYAPQIRGTARTNARVTVKQNDIIIYETTVTPGEFLIDDLYPTGYGGDLYVEVHEADGKSQSFSLPYASVTELLRPGASHYDITAGELNHASFYSKPSLFQATYRRGVNNSITAYSGIQTSSSDYYSLQAGIAFDTILGAVSTDVTQSRVHADGGDNNFSSVTGQSYKLGYSKYISDTKSSVNLAAYRYSTSGYYDFLTAMQIVEERKNSRAVNNIWRPKNRFSATLTQGLGDGFGQVFLSGYSQDYWNRNNSDMQYQFGYNNYWRTFSYSLSASRVRDYRGNIENNFSLTFSMPIGMSYSRNTPMLSAGLDHSSTGKTGERLSISGTSGIDNQYSYGATAVNYNKGVGSSGVVNGNWRSQFANLQASYGSGKHYRNASAGVDGTIIAWPDGIALSPYVSDTFTIVEAKDAKGAKVSGYSGIRVDGFGHAVVPHVRPYEINDISINPKGISYGIEFENTTDAVVPYAGSVTKVTFGTRNGIPLLITSSLIDGSPLPFGAQVLNDMNEIIGVVGQNGTVYSHVEKNAGQLNVMWGSDSLSKCHIKYDIPEVKNVKNNNDITHIHSKCVFY